MNKVAKVAMWAIYLLVILIVFAQYLNMFGINNTIFGHAWSPPPSTSSSAAATAAAAAKTSNILTAIKGMFPPVKNTSRQNVLFSALGMKSINTDNKAIDLAYETKEIFFNRTHNNGNIEKTKVTHIAFLKVHKAGSTTIQNMLFRFGIKHDLNIILSEKGNHLWEKNEVMPLRKGQHYDIFALHTIYYKPFFDSLLPANYVNIGIIREPISRMISAAYYHRDVYHVKYLRKVPRANYIHNLINFPEKYDHFLFSQTRNTMAKDFGFSKAIMTDKLEIKQYLDELNSQFLFVMVMEKFDESLIYLRRLLNWSLSDILYLKTNSHKHPPVVLSDAEKVKFRRTNSLDFYVFEYFNKIFEEKLKRVQKDFWEEVTFFKKMIKDVTLLCEQSGASEARTQTLSVKETKFSESFNVKKRDCDLMKTPELLFIDKLRIRHHKRQNMTS